MNDFISNCCVTVQASKANDMRNCALTHNLRTNFFPVIKGDLISVSWYYSSSIWFNPQQNYRNHFHMYIHAVSDYKNQSYKTRP